MELKLRGVRQGEKRRGGKKRGEGRRGGKKRVLQHERESKTIMVTSLLQQLSAAESSVLS